MTTLRLCSGLTGRLLRAGLLWGLCAGLLTPALGVHAEGPPDNSGAPPATPVEPPPAPPPTEAAPPIEARPPAEPPAPAAVPAPAELPPPEVTAAEPAEDSQGDQGEIVVTANRRATTLQKYAGAATALTQEDLDRKGIKSVRDVANATPSVEIGTQESNVEIYIRGVGTDNNTELGDPTVATHIDGVYIPRPRGVGSMLFDMERLEISRGPQGTLRGRNAVAGSLNIITAKPVLQEWLGEASMQVGNYSQRLGRGMVNVPIGDKLALRVAVYGEQHDPLYKNGGPVSTIIPSESADTIAYRATLLFEPWRMLKITLAHDFTQEKGTGYSGTNYQPALTHGFLPEEIPDPRSVIYRGPQPQQALQHWGVRGNIDVSLGPVNLEYIGSYRKLGYQQVSAGNAGVVYPGEEMQNVDDWGTSYWNTGSKSIVQELRLYAPDNSRLRWTAGGFFFNENQRAFLGSTTDHPGSYAGNEYNMPSVKNQSYAGYIDAIFDILATWRATAGARLSTDSKSRDGIGYSYVFNGLPSDVRFGTEGFRFKQFGRTDYTSGGGGMFDDFTSGIANFGARDTLNSAINQPGVTISQGSLLEQHGKYDSKFFDFRLGSDYDVSPDNLVYAQFATGHKSGGFNDNALIDGVSVAPTYKPEALYSTEVGSKNKFLDGQLAANVTAFWYHYVNQQYRAIQEIVAPGAEGKAGSATSVLFNAANSRVLGLELEVAARLPAGLRLDVAGTLLDATFTNGVVADTRLGYGSDQPMVALEGKSLPRAPKLSVNYALSQQIRTEFGKFDWTLSAQTRSIQYMTIFNGDGRATDGTVNPNLSDKVPSYTRVDLSVGYTTKDSRLNIAAYVLNLTDVTYMTSLINTPNLNLRFFNPPRQIGARLTVQL